MNELDKTTTKGNKSSLEHGILVVTCQNKNNLDTSEST